MRERITIHMIHIRITNHIVLQSVVMIGNRRSQFINKNLLLLSSGASELVSAAERASEANSAEQANE